MKKSNGIVKLFKHAFFLFSYFLLFFSNIAFSDDFIQEKDELKQHILQQQSPLNAVFSHIVGYAAVREEDMSFCDNLMDSKENCRNISEDLLEMKFLAEGRCEKFSSEMENRCVNQDTCDNLENWQKDMCFGYKQGNLALIKKAQQKHGDEEWDEVGSIEALGVYKGFKNGRNRQACEKVASTLEGAGAYLCEVMFSDFPVEDILNGVAEDLTYFLLSMKYNLKHLCNKIQNMNVREGCLSSEQETYFLQQHP